MANELDYTAPGSFLESKEILKRLLALENNSTSDGSAYKGYRSAVVGLLYNGNNQTFIPVEYVNEFLGQIQRVDVGIYKYTVFDPANPDYDPDDRYATLPQWNDLFTKHRLWMAPFINFASPSTLFLDFTVAGEIVGKYTMYPADDGDGKLCIIIEVRNGDGSENIDFSDFMAAIDWSSAGAGLPIINLPEIRFYDTVNILD